MSDESPNRERHPAPLGAENDQQRRCMRLVGETGAVHIIYRWDEIPAGGNSDDFWDHGFACPKHWAEYEQRWTCAAHHPVDGICGMPGSVYDPEQNRCRVDDLPTVEPVRAIAEVTA